MNRKSSQVGWFLQRAGGLRAGETATDEVPLGVAR